jgi:hypothetical protein
MELKRGTESWSKFIDRLSGEDGCNFRKEPTKKKPEGEYVWGCGDAATKDHFGLTKKVMKLMGIDPEQGMAEINRQGHVCCDCEIVFNMADDSDEEE